VFKKLTIIGCLTLFLLVGLLTGNAWAETSAAVPDLNTGDTAFMLISSALVLLMTPGLAFFYGGFVRSHNILNTLMMSFVLMAIVGVTWVLWGYSLSFAPGLPFIGGLQWLGLNGVGVETTGYLQGSAPAEVVSYAGTIPHQAFMIYQAMFAIITPALISGAIAERMSFRAYCLFVVLWSTFIYTPLAHMVWAKGGFLGLYGGIGALDFAGGTVVHISSGISALVAAIVLGPRKNYPDRLSPPHNVPFILLGAGLLWFGWFGFNAGSAVGSNGLAGLAFINTVAATAAACLAWIAVEKLRDGHATSLGAASGVVAGLVAITPACAAVDTSGALLVGLVAGALCALAVGLKFKFGYDDSLDVVGVHLVGGIWGSISIGLFGSSAVNSVGLDGLFFGGGTALLGKQALAVAMVAGYSFLATLIIGFAIEKTIGFRVTKESELEGVDFNEHAESAYEMSGSTRGGSLI
jgi:Amt family ammonium transporter